MKIYKYTPHISIFLKEPALALTPACYLNDPFEAKLTRKYKDDAVSAYAKILKEDNRERFSKSFREDLDNNGAYSGIVSLTTKKGSSMMMSHYANNHRGGFLEFTVSDEIKEGVNNKINLFIQEGNYNCGPVIYAGGNDRGLSYASEKIGSFKKSFFEKGHEWEIEEEIRYVADFRRSDYFIMPIKSLLDYYISRIDMIVDYTIDNDSVRFIYQDYDDNMSSLKPKKIQDVFFNIIGEECIESFMFSGLNENIIFKLKLSDEDVIFSMLALNRLVKNNVIFYPIIKVNPSMLTGIYLGARFNAKEISHEDLCVFVNLKNNIYSCELSDVDFSLEYNRIEIPISI